MHLKNANSDTKARHVECTKCTELENSFQAEKKKEEQARIRIQLLQAEYNQLKGRLTKMEFLLQNAQRDNDELLTKIENVDLSELEHSKTVGIFGSG